MTVKDAIMLETYASSYSTMSKIGDGKVSASDVAYDIRNNMIKQLSEQDKFTDPDGEVWTAPTAEAYYKVRKELTKYQAFTGIQAVAIEEIKATLKQLEFDRGTLIEERKNGG